MSTNCKMDNSEIKTYSREDFMNFRNNNIQYNNEDLIELLNKIELKLTSGLNNRYQHNFSNSKQYNRSNTQNKHSGVSSTQNSWRLKRTKIIAKDITEQEKLQNEINSLLNKMSPKNFTKITLKIMDFYKGKSDDLTDCLVDHTINNIFLKAVMQPVYCPYYVKFLKDINIKFNKESKINQRCVDFLDEVSVSNSKSPDKNDKTENNNLTEQEKYDLFCKDNKDKQYKEGYSQFIGELYNKKMINNKTLENSISHYVGSLETSSKIDPKSVSVDLLLMCLCKMVSTVYNRRIDKILTPYIERIFIIKDIDNLPKRLKFKILDLKDALNKYIYE